MQPASQFTCRHSDLVTVLSALASRAAAAVKDRAFGDSPCTGGTLLPCLGNKETTATCSAWRADSLDARLRMSTSTQTIRQSSRLKFHGQARVQHDQHFFRARASDGLIPSQVLVRSRAKAHDLRQQAIVRKRSIGWLGARTARAP